LLKISSKLFLAIYILAISQGISMILVRIESACFEGLENEIKYELLPQTVAKNAVSGLGSCVSIAEHSVRLASVRHV